MPQQNNELTTSTESMPVDAASLGKSQSPWAALIAAVTVAVCLNIAWLWLSNLSGRFFPWFSVVQGVFIGLVVRLAGRGFDWRFPALAATVTVIAAFGGNFLVSVMTTSAVLEIGPLQVLRGLTMWSWQTWYAEVLRVVDLVYALFAAAVAAIHSKRRLQRHEVFALRSAKQESAR
jgi:hypothetical protein